MKIHLSAWIIFSGKIYVRSAFFLGMGGWCEHVVQEVGDGLDNLEDGLEIEHYGRLEWYKVEKGGLQRGRRPRGALIQANLSYTVSLPCGCTLEWILIQFTQFYVLPGSNLDPSNEPRRPHVHCAVTENRKKRWCIQFHLVSDSVHGAEGISAPSFWRRGMTLWRSGPGWTQNRPLCSHPCMCKFQTTSACRRREVLQK